MWNKLKKMWSSVIRFFEEFSVSDLIGALGNLIKHIIENGISSSNILIRLLSLPFYLAFILLLGALLGIKKLFLNLYKLLKMVFKLFTKTITAIVKEIDFYWEIAGNQGKSLVEIEKNIAKKLFEYSKYQLHKIKDDDASLSNEYSEKGYIELTVSFVIRFTSWLVCVLLALIISILFVIIPILVLISMYVRKKIESKQSENDQ